MGDSHRRIGRVDMLPACAGGTHRIDTDILVADFDVDVLGLGKDGNSSRRCMDATTSLGFGNTLHPVHA